MTKLMHNDIWDMIDIIMLVVGTIMAVACAVWIMRVIIPIPYSSIFLIIGLALMFFSAVMFKERNTK